MATGYYQTPQAPRLYVSYPLFAYATGGLGSVDGELSTDEQMIKMIQLDPSDYTTISNPSLGADSIFFGYKLVPDNIVQNDINYGIDWWNFNYAMILGHNLADNVATPIVQSNQSYDVNPLTQTFATAETLSINNTTLKN